jgi:hypothetical protein
MTNKFWIVVSETRGVADFPYRHPTETEAFTEAQRLARTCSGKFFVMEAKGAAAKLDVQVSRFDDDDQIPF